MAMMCLHTWLGYTVPTLMNNYTGTNEYHTNNIILTNMEL